MKGWRSQRLSKQLRREINEIIKSDFQIPESIILTVTDVTISKDFRSCKVFLSIFSCEDESIEDAEKYILELFTQKAGYFKYIIGKHMRIKKIPNVSFVIDHTPKKAAEVFDILDRISKSK
ncbi:MAG: 30S ribosome-binding factor RbfA [Elusimicrobia bacterium]|nr:30S ribosome-binding factor RbfA [Elusimicrobiota bacterium]